MNRTLTICSVSTLAAALLAPDAHAQAAGGAAADASSRVSASLFSTLDRTDDASKLGVSIGLSLLGRSLGLRTDLFGQYMSPVGVGGFVSLPASVVSDLENGTALGNVELGGVLRVEAGRTLSLLLRGGVMLPTASGGSDGFFTNLAAGFGRLTDLASAGSDATVLRLSASPVSRNGNMLARVDIGVDLPVSRARDDAPFSARELGPLVRANAGVGTISNGLLTAGELVVVVSLDEPAVLYTAAFTARYMNSPIQPGLSIATPLDGLGSPLVVMADFVVPLGR